MKGSGLRVAVLAALVVGGYLGAPVAAADNENFTSPDGNIACYSIQKYVECDIRERDWSPPEMPQGCPGADGKAIGIHINSGGREASFTCNLDGIRLIAPGGPHVLGYGQTHSMPYYHCDSSEAGIECANDFGHGFVLGRAAYRLF